MYADDELLALSGIQHYSFCPRQWALIHLEQQWAENLLTVQGNLMHDRVHDSSKCERHPGRIVLRGMSVHSPSLGFAGQCDAVEFTSASSGIPLQGEEGLWAVAPVEYKHGKAKRIAADRLQLCAQAICLEEMLCCDIEVAFLYYGKTHSREQVVLDVGLREEVRKCAKEMHCLFSEKRTPAVKERASCRTCSLKGLCLPEASCKETAKQYLARRIGEIE